MSINEKIKRSYKSATKKTVSFPIVPISEVLHPIVKTVLQKRSDIHDYIVLNNLGIKSEYGVTIVCDAYLSELLKVPVDSKVPYYNLTKLMKDEEHKLSYLVV